MAAVGTGAPATTATLLFLLKMARTAITATRATPATVPAAVTMIVVVLLSLGAREELISAFNGASIMVVDDSATSTNLDTDDGRPVEEERKCV